MPPLEEMLARYAELTVRVGVNVQKGQRVIVRAPVSAVPFARAIVEAAYRSGARIVDVLWSDDVTVRSRFELAPRDSFDEIPTWHFDAIMAASEEGAAFITVLANDPDLLANQDPALVARQMELSQKYAAPHTQRVMSNQVAWTVASASIPEWATKVFTGVSPDEAVDRLWKAILSSVRVDTEDPIAAWDAHKASLVARRARLNGKQYTELRYEGPGTKLSVGLPQNHIWLGGVSETSGGVSFVPNLPTEEVFTMPHRDRVSGTVTSTKPLSHGGKLIEGFRFEFVDGRIESFHADEGGDVLGQLLDTDEGARRLGEVALVPHSSPISRSGILFYNTLFDENASSHLAVGRAYTTCLAGGTSMDPEALVAAGVNQSLAHVDFMIGSAEMNVDGVTQGGDVEPVMRNGEWVD